MQAEFDEQDAIFDIDFNGDICATCIHEPHCTLLKMIQTGAITVNNENPIIYCIFYQNRTVKNVFNWFKSLLPFGKF